MSIYDDLLVEVRKIVELLKRPPQMMQRDQIRVGEFLLQTNRHSSPHQVSIIDTDGERRIFEVRELESMLRQLVEAHK